MIRHLSYLDSRTCKETQELTKEVFNKLLDSEKTKQIVKEIEAEPDPDKKSVLKGKLPAVMFACQMSADGKRLKLEDGPISSGLCIHDWDGLAGDPRGIYMGQIGGMEKQEGIVLVHVTPRGHGLRLVTTMKHGETIRECQARVASRFGMTKYVDPSVADITRLSYLPSRKYMLFVDEAALFDAEIEETETEKSEVRTEQTNIQPVAAEMSKDTFADRYLYNGIRFSAIIAKLLERHASGGKPKVGERNTVLYQIAREVRHLCGYRFTDVYQLLSPYFSDLGDGEVRNTINSAINSNGKKITDTVKSVVEEARCESLGLEAEKEDELSLGVVPKLAPISEMLIRHFPMHLRNQVYLSTLPMWGAIGTHIHFRYLDGMENSLSFMTAVVGRSGSGKAFTRALYDMMTVNLKAADMEERLKAERYREEVERLPANAKKPEKPKTKIRLLSDDITFSQLLDCLYNLEGEHALQYSEEVSRLTKARRTHYGDIDDIHRRAYDNSEIGKESMSLLSRNIKCKAYLNTLFCGTPGDMHKYYNQPEGGLNNRIIFAFMPNVHLRDIPRYLPLTADERKQFDEVSLRLSEAGKDGKLIRLPFLEKFIVELQHEWYEEFRESPNNVWSEIGRRALVTAFRAGMLEWHLYGCTNKPVVRKRIKDLVRWVAETVRASVYYFSGTDYEKIDRTNEEYMHSRPRMTKNKKLFSLLNELFTPEDVRKIRAERGESTYINMILSRWIADGRIKKESKGVYRKMSDVINN